MTRQSHPDVYFSYKPTGTVTQGTTQRRLSSREDVDQIILTEDRGCKDFPCAGDTRVSFRRHVCLLPREDTRPLRSGDPSAGRGVKCRRAAASWMPGLQSQQTPGGLTDGHATSILGTAQQNRRTLAPWETQRSPEMLGAQRAGSAPPSRDGVGEPAGPSGGRCLGALSDGDGGFAPRLSFVSDDHGKNTNICNF